MSEVCILCGKDNIDKTINIENVGDLVYCEDCLPDISESADIVPPAYFFVAKPRWRNDLKREIFETSEEFEEWYEENSEIVDSYMYGIHKTTKWSLKERKYWQDNDNDSFYWLNEEECVNSTPCEHLIALLKDGDNEIWTIHDCEDLKCEPKDNFFQYHYDSIDKKIGILNKCKKRLVSLEKKREINQMKH